jgi:hypothetical protein
MHSLNMNFRYLCLILQSAQWAVRGDRMLYVLLKITKRVVSSYTAKASTVELVELPLFFTA